MQRSDGQKVKTAERIKTKEEFKSVAKILLRKDFLLVYVNTYYPPGLFNALTNSLQRPLLLLRNLPPVLR